MCNMHGNGEHEHNNGDSREHESNVGDLGGPTDLRGRGNGGPSNIVLAILGAGAMLSVAVVVAAVIYGNNDGGAPPAGGLTATRNAPPVSELEAKVLPAKGVELPVKWGDLGKRMAEAGVIDAAAFKGIYASRGGLDDEMLALLEQSGNGKVVMTPENSGVLLNMLWALGIGNKNEVLAKGEMMDPKYGGAGGFASTGGWTLAKGDPMSHYSMHEFMKLDPEAQAKVERVAKGIYRPCCGNSTHFPDCNHGMAMLGLLELMASQGVGEQDMYTTALRVNAYWFPEQYLTIASLLESQGTSWDKADPKKILGAEYSSGAGYRNVAAAVEQTRNPSATQQQPRQSGGCGV